jgi:hypothetical protein
MPPVQASLRRYHFITAEGHGCIRSPSSGACRNHRAGHFRFTANGETVVRPEERPWLRYTKASRQLWVVRTAVLERGAAHLPGRVSRTTARLQPSIAFREGVYEAALGVGRAAPVRYGCVR